MPGKIGSHSTSQYSNFSFIDHKWTSLFLNLCEVTKPELAYLEKLNIVRFKVLLSNHQAKDHIP